MGRPKKNKKICGANITQLGFIHLVCIFLVHRMRLEKDNILYGSRVKTQILNYEFESKKKYILLEKNEVICIDSYTHSF